MNATANKIETQMDIEMIRLELSSKLAQHFSVQSVSSRIVNPYRIRNNALQTAIIVGLEFIINKKERYLTFATWSEENGEVMFTRPKEGIADFLTSEIRSHDFRYRLTNDINTRFDLLGRFIDSWISMRALNEMREVIRHYAEQINPNADYCLGYKVTAHHKHTKTFDSRFEILVRKGDEDKYTAYNGEFLSGQLHHVADRENVIVTMEDVFGV